MPIIQNAKGVQFWRDVNAKLEKLGKTVEDIHDVCPELAISTLKKWQSKGALPASEHICLIKSCLDQWGETQPAQENVIQAGENPMVINNEENEKLKAKIEAQEKRLWAFAARIKNANKRLRSCGQPEVKADDIEESNSDNERIAELEETIQARDIEIEEMRKQLDLASDMYNKVCESSNGQEVSKLKEKIAELQQQLQEAQENSPELVNLKESLTALSLEYDKAMTKNKEVMDELERTSDALMNVKEMLVDADEEVKRIQAIAKEYVDELAQRNRVIEVYEKEKQALIRQLEVLHQERGTATKPNYYIKNGIECKDLIAVMLADVSGINAFNLGNALKYLWRWQGKNGAEDLSKAITYLEEIRNDIIEQTAEKSQEA